MYKYEENKHKLFLEEYQKGFLKIRDKVKELISIAGCVSLETILENCTECGIFDSWVQIACADRLAELGEIVEIQQQIQPKSWDKNRIFIFSKK